MEYLIIAIVQSDLFVLSFPAKIENIESKYEIFLAVVRNLPDNMDLTEIDRALVVKNGDNTNAPQVIKDINNEYIYIKEQYRLIKDINEK